MQTFQFRTTFIALMAGSSVATWNALGCYQDGSSAARMLLGSYALRISTMTLEYCAAFCTRYQYFAVESATDMVITVGVGSGIPATDGRCNMTCGGNSSEICGGASRANLFIWNSTPSSSSSSVVSSSTLTSSISSLQQTTSSSSTATTSATLSTTSSSLQQNSSYFSTASSFYSSTTSSSPQQTSRTSSITGSLTTSSTSSTTSRLCPIPTGVGALYELTSWYFDGCFAPRLETQCLIATDVYSTMPPCLQFCNAKNGMINDPLATIIYAGLYLNVCFCVTSLLAFDLIQDADKCGVSSCGAQCVANSQIAYSGVVAVGITSIVPLLPPNGTQLVVGGS